MPPIPIIVVVIFFGFVIIITYYNEMHRSKYNKLMAYLKQHHPEIYERIRIKPIFGIFYEKGAYKDSIDYAKRHEPLNDPIAEALLADYAEFSQKGVWLVGAAVFIALVIFTLWLGWRYITM